MKKRASWLWLAASAAVLAGCSPTPHPVRPLPFPAQTPVTGEAAPTPSPVSPVTSALVFPSVAEPALSVALQVHQASLSLPKRDYLIDTGGEVLRYSGPVTLTPANGGGISVTGSESTWVVKEAIRLAPADPAEYLKTSDGAYRGIFVIRVGTKGLLHLINRVSMEDYLKGVVPAEMGPRVFDELEALKAQAIAARSYAAKHRGESAAEGYDLCATPRCQVYSGVNVEHPLSSRAVDETAGEVLLFGQQIADTLFTSTCGGRTERATDVFPAYDKNAYPYLVSVPCSGETPQKLTTSLALDGKPRTLLAIRGRSLLASLGVTGSSYADLVEARNAMRKRLGLPLGGGPKTLAPDVVFADWAKAAGLEDLDVLIEPSEIDLAPRTWPLAARKAYAVALRFDVSLASPLPRERFFQMEEVSGLYATVLSRLGALEEQEVRLLSVAEGKTVAVRGSKGKETLELIPKVALFSGLGDVFKAEREAAFFPGDRARVFTRNGKICGLSVLENGPQGLYDRDSAWSYWTRCFTGQEIMTRMRERDKSRPGKRVTRVEILGRAVSGRATRVKIVTDEGSFTLTGLEIRFSLGIPENLFTVTPGKESGGEPVFTFHGRGWGHGVGLCQNGAFGMALAGKNYREILSHFYPGTTISKLDKTQNSQPAIPQPAAEGPAGEERRNR